jgi:restriction system protein
MNFEQLRQDLEWLRKEDGSRHALEAESVLARLLQPLLSHEGFEIVRQANGRDSGVDFEATNRDSGSPISSIGIEYKHSVRGRPIWDRQIRSLVDSGLKRRHARLMLIARFGFTKSAVIAVRDIQPIAVDLLDLEDIGRWISKLELQKPDNAARFQALIRSISHRFAEEVARDPEMLDQLEWRDLERMIARILEGLGFKVDLTPASKDGGKDLVLSYLASQGELSAIIELKHWRSKKRVGAASVEHFLQVIVKEGRAGGLFISTSGYTSDAFEGLTKIERKTLRFGDSSKVALLARTYTRAASGLWSPPSDLTDVLFQATK